ncbi:16S rRNA (cytidine(1402)-2'-O)-methyltransferase [Veillonella caviae]|uniref:16S rRNA (cytidine(1402)-2'-O)-methyltransferase n=1 Tax=Veillonella caviae TaxID=248316 RepID=UPI000F8DFE4F|nr:16S rRNA (cytidine(1402)-2'-O)-methyltransferase [Veillonella caviae]MCF0158083.1 16S rRNA (cytidine(1402)-2'-O)-methyltransferase [Veillonella sp.]MCI5708328.1 16S rRNA (cytidine(1402)-2'-O)-methyltransferase [Veillonella caviae]MDD7291785.1 16S rRNA (cytidine(1402)-2'-O)-methyltransferase [Veillonella caviae]MDY5715919.1 16S rRNA (cytidine(1402)-2'-O)-methyltransferase [Veillonella caviae]
MNENKKGTLYLVPTPIGNLEDMTYRAVRVLGEVDAIAAEDTRHTGILLKHFDISKPLISYHEHNKTEKGTAIIDMLLEGKDIACVSDAGMPAISDPGADLVAKAIDADLEVVPLPGPNAALTALIASNLDTKQFTFVGFLPKRGKHRNEVLQLMAKQTGTLLFYEAPHRLEEVLFDMYKVFGNRPITIARELTKKFQTFMRSDLASICKDVTQITYKGEFVLVVGGVETGTNTEVVTDEPISYEEEVTKLIAGGMAKKEAIREVAKRFGVSRRDVYNLVERQ